MHLLETDHSRKVVEGEVLRWMRAGN